jgi:hypothetical protein
MNDDEDAQSFQLPHTRTTTTISTITTITLAS